MISSMHQHDAPVLGLCSDVGSTVMKESGSRFEHV